MATPVKNTAQALRRMTHGASISRLVIGQLPDCMKRQLSTARKYRRDLEQVVLAAKGEVTLTDAHWVDECIAAENHCAIMRWLLRTRLDKMSAEAIISCSREILKAKTARNKAFAELKLDKSEQDMLATLYLTPDEPEPTDVGDEPSDADNAAGAKPESQPEETQS